MYKLSHEWYADFDVTVVTIPELGDRVITTCWLYRGLKSSPRAGVAIKNPFDIYDTTKARKTAFLRALDAMLPYSACRSANDIRAFRNARRSLWESLIEELNK